VVAPEALNLSLVLEQILPLIRRRVGESIDVSVALNESIYPIRADRGQLETLIINLAMHARETMGHGGTLTLSAKNLHLETPRHENVRLRAGDYVVLSISDTGLGLSPEFQEHLFEPFFGAGQPGKNTGLAMATVYAIVKQHGGQISCISEIGKGSRFEIYFPAQRISIPEHAPKLPNQHDQGSSGGVILMAEDEEILRNFGNLVLRKHGFHVLTARDGVEALKIAEQFEGRVDLLFTDVVMPRMGGPELFKRFSEMNPEIPVIFTSGYPRTVLADSGLDADGLEFLQKPYTPQSLLEKIRAVLAMR
jgi:two-component system, cell cycle sensor histidine kinase and response regulator CckA